MGRAQANSGLIRILWVAHGWINDFVGSLSGRSGFILPVFADIPVGELSRKKREGNMAGDTTRRDRRDTQSGNFTDQRLFTQPWLGKVRGQKGYVVVKALGNAEGHSPAYLCENEEGDSMIQSIEDVKRVPLDISAIVPTEDQVRRLLDDLR